LDNLENINPSKLEEWWTMKEIDPDYYRHHMLGQWAEISDHQVFTHFKWEWEPPEDAEVIYGLDFGFATDPCALTRVHKKGKRLWIEELIYETGLTNEDLYERMKALGLGPKDEVIADSSEPKSIEELKRLGIKGIKGAKKGPDSVRAGIQKIRGYEVYGNPHSEHLIEEINNYVWNPTTGKPRDAFNHCCDSFRYAVSGLDAKPKIGIPNMGRLIKKNEDED
jgi:phage terminase large subunit